MTYLTQGKVQVRVNDKVTVVINPAACYWVKHQGKDYTVFLEKVNPCPNPKSPLEYRVFLSSDQFTIDKKNNGLIQILTETAFKQTKIEIEIKIEGIEKRIVAVSVPAPQTV